MKTRFYKAFITTSVAALTILPSASIFAAEEGTPVPAATPAIKDAAPAPSVEVPATSTTVSGEIKVTPAPAETATLTANAIVTKPVKLPYGVNDVLRLSQAQVGEDVIMGFVQNSGIVYDLRPDEILYLKESGVSDRVVYAMIDQKRHFAEANAAAQAAAAQGQAYPYPTDNPAVASAPSYTENAPDYTAPADQQAPASTVYVIPNYSSGYSYYPHYYYPYGSYYVGPSVAFRFGGAGHSYYRSYNYGHGNGHGHVVHYHR